MALVSKVYGTGGGDAIDSATTALLEELVDFFPKGKRELLAKALGKLKTLENRAKHGSIAVVERFHRTFKELMRRTIIPEEQSAYEHEAQLIIDWYNEHRPHMTLEGKTPNEVYYLRPAANEQPRFEPRECWPVESPCAKPQVEVDGDPGDAIILELDCLQGRRHLPIIRSRRAA